MQGRSKSRVAARKCDSSFVDRRSTNVVSHLFLRSGRVRNGNGGSRSREACLLGISSVFRDSWRRGGDSVVSFFFFFWIKLNEFRIKLKWKKKMEIRHDLILDYFIDYYNQLFYFSFFLTFSFLRKRLFEIRYTVERYLYILLLSRE